MEMASNFLVTGGAGFIGFKLAKRLLQYGHEVVIVDNLITGSMDNVPEGAKFVYMDLANENHYYKLDWFHPDAIIHLAGQSSGETSHESPINDLDINTKATILLGNWALNQKCKRLIFASSVSVYGDGVTPGEAMSEKDPPQPKSFYGCSKLASEYYLHVFNQSYGLNTTSFRFFNVYGAGQNMKNMKQGMVSIYLSYILFHRSLLVKGPLERYRDFVYVSDVVDLLVNSIEDQRTYDGIFNVGSGRKTYIRGLIDKMLSIVNKPGFPIEEAAGTPGDTFGSLADVSHIKERLNWEAKVSLEVGLEEMVEFYSR